jgi:hypothetical protein
VHRFSAAGQLIASWGQGGKTEPNQFHLPYSLVADHVGRIYVCDRESNRIQVFSAEGDFRAMWTDLRRPLDISLDRDGIFCISEGGVSGLSHDGDMQRDRNDAWKDAEGAPDSQLRPWARLCF